eukprot:comp22376_c0_seq1/m.33359 comp22376_c0_seq1/g.33359  ORF comp22376_c0_seq1/g.33359 comp22376_c0_seq1/m.33359 type:complete len:298 (-) comp22376_c0_seq1:41-934(-)
MAAVLQHSAMECPCGTPHADVQPTLPQSHYQMGRDREDDNECLSSENSSLDSQSIADSSCSEHTGPQIRRRNSKVRLRAKTRLMVDAALAAEAKAEPTAEQPTARLTAFRKTLSLPLRAYAGLATTDVPLNEEILIESPHRTRALSHDAVSSSKTPISEKVETVDSEGTPVGKTEVSESSVGYTPVRRISEDVIAEEAERLDEEMAQNEMATLHALSVADLEAKVAALNLRLARQTDVLLGELCLKAELEAQAAQMRMAHGDEILVDLDSLELYAKIADPSATSQIAKPRRKWSLLA